MTPVIVIESYAVVCEIVVGAHIWEIPAKSARGFRWGA